MVIHYTVRNVGRGDDIRLLVSLARLLYTYAHMEKVSGQTHILTSCFICHKKTWVCETLWRSVVVQCGGIVWWCSVAA